MINILLLKVYLITNHCIMIYIKTKIKLYNNKVYTNFQYRKIPRDDEYCICLFVKLLDSILANSGKEYYSEIFL